MNAEQAARLREPFLADMIGKLPRAGITLDYVGHAATTDRLLQVDPEWTWEPMGRDEHGNPAIVSGLGEANEPVCLWINLTVCGVTRPGFGSGKTAKIAIGDAIRNAAMRFGVALDLWAKEDLHSNGSGAVALTPPTGREIPVAEANSPADAGSTAAPDSNGEAASPAKVAHIGALIGDCAKLRKTTQKAVKEALAHDGYLWETDDQADSTIAKLETWQRNLVAAK